MRKTVDVRNLYPSDVVWLSRSFSALRFFFRIKLFFFYLSLNTVMIQNEGFSTIVTHREFPALLLTAIEREAMDEENFKTNYQLLLNRLQLFISLKLLSRSFITGNCRRSETTVENY